MGKRQPFTPGDWRVYRDNEEAPNIAYVRGNSHEGNFDGEVCVLYGQDNKANARLIAAAPEILRALKEMVHEFGDDNPDDDWECVQDARAAIAKATGEDQ